MSQRSQSVTTRSEIAPAHTAPSVPPSPLKNSISTTQQQYRSSLAARDNRYRALWGVFRGSASIRIGYINPLTRQLEGYTHHRTGVVASIGQPKVAAGIRERNPFSLSIGSTPGEIAANKQGAFTTYSAIPYNFRGGYLAEYWRVRITGNRVAANLSDPHTAEALAANQITALQNIAGIVIPWPYVMRQGTTLRGTITRSRIQVTIRGLDSGLTRSFVITITARRSR